MLINGTDIATLGVKLYDRVINSNEVDTTHEWLDGDIQPTFIRQQDRFKKISLSFLVLGQDEDDAFLRISKLTQLIKKATLAFDDISYTFDVAMIGAAKTSRLKNGNFIVSYDFDSDYAKGEREIYTTDATATTMTKITVVYYKNQTTLLGTETKIIRAGAFTGVNDTLASIGIDVDKYKEEHYNSGVATNLGRLSLTYENLAALNTLIINYSPIKYNLTISYWLNSGQGYGNTTEKIINFTAPQVEAARSIGQIVDAATFKPDGYRATIDYDGELTVEALLAASPIKVLYDVVENETSKNITILYQYEDDDGNYAFINNRITHITETSIIQGMTLGDIVKVDSYNPNVSYYQEGKIEGHTTDELITYDTIEANYTVNYRLRDNIVYVEYYAGTYPDWYRLSTIPVHIKYNTEFENSFELSDLNIDVDKYHTSEYQTGVLLNAASYTTYDSILSAGVLQIYYVPIDFPLTVRYYTNDTDYVEEDYTINALQFFNNPSLGDLIDLTAHRPEGYQLDLANSYGGDITLAELTLSSPITVMYEEIVEMRTKNILVKYKQRMSSTYSTLNTSILVVNEADTLGGVRLKNLINLNQYRPEYYEQGYLNGVSANELFQFDDLQANYEVLYDPITYTTPVYYYTDDIDQMNWVGSSSISYSVIDFTQDTTLFELGLDLNLYKSAFTGNGVIQYNGPVNFSSLRALASIDILYMTESEPDDPTGIDYPHRVLFLQHNDLGSYEYLHPTWTMNHAYINTGITAMDMSQISILMECRRVDENVGLDEVNAGYAYLFGSSSPLGQFYMRYNNQKRYSPTASLDNLNYYEAKVGNTTAPLVMAEENNRNDPGWSANTQIRATAREGYSQATFTYTWDVAAEHAQMPYPIYLFANNNAGSYADGLAGIGITGCKIYIGNNLVRDFIPVQFYDKIGTQIAPSNCLYDKVSQTFFEDGTGLNSFNIIDDENYTDLNPEHQIGSCIINYYKDNVLFETFQKFFRGNDFDDDINLYDFLMVDERQPAYYSTGTITNLPEIAAVNFENINNYVFNVNYTALENIIEVYYYKDYEDQEHLLASERIAIQERDFYQVPTFGDIVRLNKYRPEGYKTDFTYQGAKVSMARVMDNSPYTIIYTPITETEQTYTTSIRYMKKVWGIRTYETLGTVPLTLTESQFRDGEYIEYFIDYNAMKPAEYYGDGAPYQWYEHDLRLDTPDNLQPEYVIYYLPTLENVEVRYYTDDIDEANLVASTNWPVSVDEFDGQFYIVDQLPNVYVNKFKPANCDGGVVQNTDVLYTFDSLLQYGHIDILYMTIAEPHDPTNEAHIDKVLYWTGQECPSHLIHSHSSTKGGAYYMTNNACVPTIDLGYTPKEIGRLKVEIKGYFQTDGFNANTTGYGFQRNDYTYAFGYYGALGAPVLNHHDAEGQTLNANSDLSYRTYRPKESLASTGAFALRGHVRTAQFGTYTDAAPVGIDGERWFRTTYDSVHNSATAEVTDLYDGLPKTASITGFYRKGKYEDEDENYNDYVAYKNYSYSRGVAYSDYVDRYAVSNDTSNQGHLQNKWFADPITYTLDAYHSYASAYDWGNSNMLTYVNFDESEDNDNFETRCKPVGSLTLFHTRNPDTGRINVMPFSPITYPAIGGGIGVVGFSQNDIQRMMNPFSGDWTGQVITYTNVIGQDNFGNPITSTTTQTRGVAYSDFPCPVYPGQYSAAIWHIKIWDQDRLVRDMIPVKAGEQIYDYTAPQDGLFDLITEIFFGNSNEGGTYTENYYLSNMAGQGGMVEQTITIRPNEIIPLHVVDDPCYWGKITENYYDENNHFIDNQFVAVPTWFYPGNSNLETELQFNDFKPSSYYLDGILDTDDPDDGHQNWGLHDIYEQGLINIYYKLRTYAKSVLYYKDDYRVGSQDLFFSLADIENANSLADLNITADRYADPNFQPGRLVFDENILQENDVAGFIDAPSPVVVYDKFDAETRPDLMYLEYYRGGAYDDENAPMSIDPNSNNYLVCNLTAKVLNPNGTIKYRNHYHSALYEDEPLDYFIPYQVRVVNPYTGIHYGPARKYKTLATIAVSDIYTIVEERNGWGRLREYYHGWILLDATVPVAGPGQNPDYDDPTDQTATIPFGEVITITKLTVDRLWAYVPAEESWVKAEEISFDQAGKLYNALDIQVIDLNDVDWSTAESLNDVGIYPNSKRLQFHNLCPYAYSGPYTQEAFAAIHSLDFVYPETVYNYICHYYKEHKTDNNELGTAAFSCSISDWNPDWDHFIETSWRYDNQNNLILPELYRGAPISLNWDYFGFNKNLFKPTGYYDGIYLWNPHPWDEEHLFFTFDELVRVGAQYVVYPEIDPHAFKYWCRSGSAQNDSQAATTVNLVIETEDPLLDTQSRSTTFYQYPIPQPNMRAASGNEIISDTGFRQMDGPWVASPRSIINNGSKDTGSGSRYYWYIGADSIALYSDLYERWIETASNTDTTEYTTTSQLVNDIITRDLYGLMLFNRPAMYRIYTSETSPYANLYWSTIPYHNEFEPMYALRMVPATLSSTERSNNSNTDYMKRIYSSNSSFYTNTTDPLVSGEHPVYPRVQRGLYHGIRSYSNNYELMNYYIPVPKGMWYKWNDAFQQIQHNGMFDIMSGRLLYLDPGEIFRYDFRSGINDDLDDYVYNYFEGWQFTTTTFSNPGLYTAQAALTSRSEPDDLAPLRHNIPSGTLFPADKSTNDTASRVDGTWYDTGDGWVRRTPLRTGETGSFVGASTDTTFTINKQKTTFVILPDTTTNTNTSNYYTYKDPRGNNPTSTEYTINNNSWEPTKLTAYWIGTKRIQGFGEVHYRDYYFDGEKWYDKDQTSLNTTTDQQTLVLSVNALNYYSLPIATDEYKLGQYLAGDRVLMEGYSTRDPQWAYSFEGWFRIDDNFSNT